MNEITQIDIAPCLPRPAYSNLVTSRAAPSVCADQLCGRAERPERSDGGRSWSRDAIISSPARFRAERGRHTLRRSVFSPALKKKKSETSRVKRVSRTANEETRLTLRGRSPRSGLIRERGRQRGKVCSPVLIWLRGTSDVDVRGCEAPG